MSPVLSLEYVSSIIVRSDEFELTRIHDYASTESLDCDLIPARVSVVRIKYVSAQNRHDPDEETEGRRDDCHVLDN